MRFDNADVVNDKPNWTGGFPASTWAGGHNLFGIAENPKDASH